MKKFILAAAVITLLASCATQDEVVKLSDNSIKFTTNLSNSVITKTASEATVSLGVYAFTEAGHAYFADNELKDNSTSWVLDPKQYWPIDGTTKLKFAAYGPYGDANITTRSCDATSGVAFTFAHAASDTPGTGTIGTDAIVSAMTTAIGNNTTVVLTEFGHALTQLVFTAKLSGTSNPTLKVKINDLVVKSAVSADYAAGAWGNFGANGKHVLVKANDNDYTVANATAAAVGTYNTINVIPNSLVDATTRQIEVKASAYKVVDSADVLLGSKTVTINVDGATDTYVAKWVMGTQVTYTITLDADAIIDADTNKKPIEFSDPMVTTWATTTATGDIGL